MTCAPDWTDVLRRASYGGVSFEVETEKQSGTRRIKYHEFPHVDDPYAEDLGEGPRKFSITAFVHGQDAGDASQSLVRVLASGGAKMLVLPLFGSLQATCPEWTQTREKDADGYIAFDIVFVRDRGFTPASFVTGELGRLAEIALDGLQAPLAASFSDVFKGVGVADFVTTSSAGLIENLAGSMEVLRTSFPLESIASANLQVGIGRLFEDAQGLASTGVIGDLISPTSFIASAINIPHELPGRVFGLMDGFSVGAVPSDAFELFGGLAEFESPFLLGAKTVNRQIEAVNHGAIEKLVRRSALGSMAVAATRMDYKTRRQGIAARAQIAEMFDVEMGG
jgi:DNA circularisation protein N-terminus